MPALGPDEAGVGVGLGNYQGYTAIGMNFKKVSESGNMSWGVGASTTGTMFGVNAGIGWKW
jgi:hypothetical protein